MTPSYLTGQFGAAGKAACLYAIIIQTCAVCKENLNVCFFLHSVGALPWVFQEQIPMAGAEQ